MLSFVRPAANGAQFGDFFDFGFGLTDWVVQTPEQFVLQAHGARPEFEPTRGSAGGTPGKDAGHGVRRSAIHQSTGGGLPQDVAALDSQILTCWLRRPRVDQAVNCRRV